MHSARKSLFKNLPNDIFITRIAHNAEQARNFIEIDFEYVTREYTVSGKTFRKRKQGVCPDCKATKQKWPKSSKSMEKWPR